MRRHLLLLTFTLILSHFSILNLWAQSAQDTWIGTGNASYTNQFKWYSLPAVTLPSNVVNIQNPWSCPWGIYVTFPESDFNQVYYNGTQKTDGTDYKINGAGILFYISSLTAQNTVILIKKDNNTKYGLRIYNSAVTINAAGTELLYSYADGEYTSASGSETSCAGTISSTNNIITGSDFYWSGRHSATVQRYDNTWTGVASSITCCSRDEITFSASTYKISIVTKNTEGGTTRKLPKVQINGTNYSVQRVIVGGVSQSFSDNQWTYAGNTETTLEYDIDYSSSGSGTYHVSTVTDGGDKDKYLFKSLTITEDAAESVCPSAYSFHYGTNEQSDWTVACFENGSETDERVITDFTIPTVPDFYVGWEGNPLANNMTALHSWNDNVSDLGSGVMNGAMILSPVGGTSKVGWAQGAVGTLRCWYGSTSKNQYVSFQPNGYGITYGGNSYAFSTTATANMLETDVVTLPNVSTTYTMGIETATEGTYVTCAHSSAAEAISNMGVTVVGGGKKAIYLVPGSFNDAGAKYAVYDVTSGKFDTDFMSDSDGDGIYVGYVGSNCSTMILCRMNSDATTTDLANNNWDKRWNQTANIGISGDLAKKYTITDMNTWNACAYTTANMQPITGQKGKFRMWDNSGSQNWYVHWIPYYVLTYDSNGGSGTTAATERNSESSTLTVSVASNGFTAPTGKHFIGWAISQANADAGTVDYAAGASYTLTSNATLYAVWAWDTYTITYNAGTGVITGSHANDTKTYGVNLTLPGATFSKTGYTQTGWATTEGGSQAYALSGSYTENDAAELYPVWTAKTTTITIDANTSYHGSAGSSVTATWGQALPAFTAAEGESGYGLVGYYTGANDGTKIINADGTLVQNVTGYTSNDATPVWIYETSTLDLYPHYEEMTTYSVTVNRNNDSYGTVTGAGSYASGATVNITATPTGGYEFVEWTTSDGVTFVDANSASTSFTMIGSTVTVQANFKAETCVSDIIIECEDDDYLIEPTAAAQGMPEHYLKGDDAYYSEFNGKYIEHKSEANNGYTGEMYYLIRIPKNASYTFTVRVGSNKNQYFNLYSTDGTYDANKYVTYGGVTYYKKQAGVAVGNSSSESDHHFRDVTASTVSLTAGYYVVGLYGEGWATWDQIKIHDNSTYYVRWAAGDGHTGGFASVQTSSGANVTYNQAVPACTNVTFTANAMATGYVLSHWEVNGVRYPTYDGLYTFNIDVNRDINVTVHSTTASTYAVTVNTNNGSYGSASADAATYSVGETVTLTATPETGYGFVNWTTSDGVSFADATSASTTFTMPAKAVTVTANFAPLRTIHFEVEGGNGTVSAKVKATSAVVSDGDQIASGTILTFTATPSSGYSVLGWYTYASSTETYQADTRATNTFDYELTSDMTIRVKFTKIRIATGDANLGSTDGYANSNDGSTIATSNVDDPEGKFNHKVLQVDYKMVSASDQTSYRGISLPVDNGYTTSIASGKAGMGFWYRTESTTDKVLTYFCIGGTDGSNQFENLLPATNGKWQYWYIETDKVDDNTTFGFYINGTKNSKSTGTINANAKFWLSEVEPVTMYSVTVNRNNDSYGTASADKEMYQPGETVTLTATPTNSNYAFLNWTTNDGVTFSNANSASTTFTMPSSDVTVQANFTEIVVNTCPSGYDDCQIMAVHTSGDEYTPTGISNAGWDGTSATFTAFADGSGKKACKINSGSTYYYGINIGNSGAVNRDVSGYTKLHIEFWSAEAQTFNFHLLAHNDNGTNQDGSAQSVSTTAGTWVVKDYNLSSVGITGTNLERVYGFKIDYISGSGKELLIANAYFYKDDAPCSVNANRTDLDECRVLSVIGTTKYDTIGISGAQGWSSESGQRLTIGSKGDNNVWRIYNGTASAVHLRTESNVQFYNKIHLEVWSATERNIEFGLLCNVGGWNENQTGWNRKAITTKASMWTTVDYTLTELTTEAYLANATHLYFFNLESKDLYITNVYFYNDDATKPVITSATNNGVSGTDLTLTLTATYKGNTLKDFRITNTTTSEVYDRTANGSNQVTIPNIEYCESYDLEIHAIYNSCILSDATEMSVNGNSLAANTALITTTSTVHADVENVTYAVSEAIDNNTGTRWSSGNSLTDAAHWYTVDLGKVYDVASMKIGWETACPKDYYIEGSVDGTNYYPLKHETTAPANAAGSFSAYDSYTFASSVGVQYLKVRSVTNNTDYGMSIWEMQAYGQCYSESANPVTTYAQVASQVANGANTAVNVTLDLGAYDYETAFSSMYYKITYTPAGGDATVLDNQTATAGQFALNGLAFNTTYTVRVQARDANDGNLSDNYVEFEFTTPDKQSTLFLRNSINWQDAGLSTDYRFSYVGPGSDVLHFAITPNSNELQYRPYNDANNNLAVDDSEISGGGFCTPGNQFINGQIGNTVTFYAKDKEHFVSTADLVYVVGSAVKADVANALQMHQSGTTYYWEGPVTVGNKYKIIVKAQESNNIAAASFTDHSCSRIMADSATFTNSEGYGYAKLTFDMTTWEYEWTEADTFIFDNNEGSGDGKWSTASNWMNNALPTIEKDVIILAEAEVDITNALAKSVVIDQNGSNSGQLVLGAGNELVVATTVRKTTDGETYGATDENDIVFNSDASHGLGALVMGTHDGTNKATVNFYTLSHGSSGSSASVNQYVGTPFNDETNILYNWYNSWVYGIVYDGSGNIGWGRVNEGQGMTPFKGYTVISADPAGHSYWQQGTLNATTDQTISGLNWQSGSGAANENNENLLANSWMAPIKIAAMELSDFVNTDATVYIFNSGSPDDYKTNNGASSSGSSPGQYSTYTINMAGGAIIPAMQSFSVFTNASGGSSVILDYSKIVYDPAVAGTVPATNRAPQRRTSAEEANKLRLFVSAESGYGDMVYMWERSDFAEGFENGWDGRKVFGEPVAPQLYAVTPDGNMAVNCVPDFEGTLLGFQAGTSANSYTFTFEYTDEAEELYLRDMDTNAFTRVMNGNSYTFTTSDRTSHNRFVLTKNAPQSPTDIAETGDGLPVTGARKVIINDHVYVIRGGKMFSVDGQLVK